jgi:hypothetical protein
MSENYFDGSVNAGSPIIGSVPNPNIPGSGEAPVVATNEAATKDLESLVGRQGQELGEFRKFFSDIAPLLDKLDKDPGLVQAIVEGHITPELAKAAMEGKISIADAQIVTEAQKEVQKDLGKKGYEGASSAEISKLVEDKAKEIEGKFQKELKDRDDLIAFQTSVNDFISKTADFPQYAAEIDKWLDEHDVTDIAVAYYAVKGELSVKEAKKQADIDKAEAEKNFAMNTGGGSSSRTYIRADDNMVDSLIAPKANPNIF